MCEKEYKSWEGLFYHKRKVHNCTDIYSRRYELELELKSPVKPVKKEVPKCMLCSKKSYYREKIEVYCKVHRDSFKWIECEISCGRFPCGKVREEEFKDHIRRHNEICSEKKSKYYMEPEMLEDLFNTEHLDVVQELKSVEEKRLKERSERDRKHSKLMASRPPLIERCPFSGEILGCRQ